MSSLKKNTLSIVVLTYNVKGSLKDAVNSVLKAVKGKFRDYEVIISDGGSSDRTLEIADNLALKNKKIKVLRNKNIGMGYSYWKGVEMASMDYCTMFPGDNENSGVYFAKTLSKIGEADIIIPYTINQKVRTFHRRVISDAFVWLMNNMFNLKLRYYNGNAIYRTKDLRKLKIRAKNFSYNSEILVRLIKSGHSYSEIGIKIKPTNQTTAFSIKNIFEVIKNLVLLFNDINIKKNIVLSLSR